MVCFFCTLFVLSLNLNQIKQWSAENRCQSLIRALEGVWQDHPQWLDLGTQLARCYVQDLSYDEAWRTITAIQQRADPAVFLSKVAELFLQLSVATRRYERGEQLVEQAFEAGSLNPSLLEWGLRLKEAQQDYEGAIKWLHRAEHLMNWPKSFQYREKEGDYLFYLGRQREAILAYFEAMTGKDVQPRLKAKLGLFPSALVRELGISFLSRRFSYSVMQYLSSFYKDFNDFFQNVLVKVQWETQAKIEAVYRLAREKGGRYYCEAILQMQGIYGKLFPYTLRFPEYKLCRPKADVQQFCAGSISLLDQGRCLLLEGEKKLASEKIEQFVYNNPEDEESVDGLELLFAIAREKQALAQALVWLQFEQPQKALHFLLPPSSPMSLALAMKTYIETKQPDEALILFRDYPQFQNNDAVIYYYAKALKAMKKANWEEPLFKLLRRQPKGLYARKARALLQE